MGFAEAMLAQAEAIDRSSDALERSNGLLARQLELVENVKARMDDFQGTAPLGPAAPPGLDPVPNGGPGGGGGVPPPPSIGTRTVTYQGPNGQLQEILGPDGRVVSIVPVGPQRTSAGPLFSTGGGAGSAGAAAGGPAGAGGNTQAGAPQSVAPGVLPPSSGRGLTGSTAGGKTVVATLDVLRQYCHATEYTVPDPTVPTASPTKGPWIRRTVWTCPTVPLILPEGGTFVEEAKVAGGLGAGFIGQAQTTESSSAPGSAGGGGGSAAQSGSNSGGGGGLQFARPFAPPTAPPTSVSSPSSTPTGPTPGERLIAGVARDLGIAIKTLTQKIGATDGGLSLRTKGLTL